MEKISWVALRQLEALRESVAFTLDGRTFGGERKKSNEYKAEWLSIQGVQPHYLHDIDNNHYTLNILRTIEHAISEHGVNLLYVSLAGTRSRFDEADIGLERGSTGWDNLPNFITSSALIRLLGALEQFEIDVLKALLYYRPAGKEHANIGPYTVVELAVINEQADPDGRYSMPALWSWLKKSADNSVERRILFKRVFDIECFPSSFGSKTSSEIRSYYQDLYDMRNSLAHGRKRVDVTLAQYCEAEAFVLSLLIHLSERCKEKYNLGI